MKLVAKVIALDPNNRSLPQQLAMITLDKVHNPEIMYAEARAIVHRRAEDDR